MAGMSEEEKFSKALEKNIRDVNVNTVVLHYNSRNEFFQLRMMDLILAFLGTYSSYWESGAYEPGDQMYPLGEMAHRMMATLSVSRGTGRHHAE